MRLLLDTHIFLAVIGSEIGKLPAHTQDLLSGQEDEYHLSAASLWEIAIKCRLGKLRLSTPLAVLPELVDGLGIEALPINEQHAVAFPDPPPATRDPFDRMLLAQCQTENMQLVTVDHALISHPLAAKR